MLHSTTVSALSKEPYLPTVATLSSLLNEQVDEHILTANIIAISKAPLSLADITGHQKT